MSIVLHEDYNFCLFSREFKIYQFANPEDGLM